jgi:hypothetical protein
VPEVVIARVRLEDSHAWIFVVVFVGCALAIGDAFVFDIFPREEVGGRVLLGDCCGGVDIRCSQWLGTELPIYQCRTLPWTRITQTMRIHATSMDANIYDGLYPKI